MIKPIEEMSSDELHQAAQDNLLWLKYSQLTRCRRMFGGIQTYYHTIISHIATVLMKM